jgi:hypothetical protein
VAAAQAGTLVLERASVELELPVLDGPPVAAPPTFAPPPPSDDGEESEIELQPPVVRLIERDTVGRQTRVETSYGSRSTGPYGARIEERYEGLVGVAWSTPGRAWASARARYDIVWPEATVATEAHLQSRSSARAYHVLVEIVASEDGTEGIGHVERRFERTIPRRLQ